MDISINVLNHWNAALFKALIEIQWKAILLEHNETGFNIYPN